MHLNSPRKIEAVAGRKCSKLNIPGATSTRELGPKSEASRIGRPPEKCSCPPHWPAIGKQQQLTFEVQAGIDGVQIISAAEDTETAPFICGKNGLPNCRLFQFYSQLAGCSITQNLMHTGRRAPWELLGGRPGLLLLKNNHRDASLKKSGRRGKMKVRCETPTTPSPTAVVIITCPHAGSPSPAGAMLLGSCGKPGMIRMKRRNDRAKSTTKRCRVKASSCMRRKAQHKKHDRGFPVEAQENSREPSTDPSPGNFWGRQADQKAPYTGEMGTGSDSNNTQQTECPIAPIFNIQDARYAYG